jgi:hypothetical protein
LRADKGVASSPSGITQWVDQSGNGNDALPPLGQPELEASFSGFGGAPAVDFVASEKELFEIDDSPELDNTDEITIFSVVQADILDGNPRGILAKRFDFDDQNERNDDQYAYGTFLYQNDEFNFDVSSSGNRTAASSFSANTPYLFQARYSQSERASEIYTNGNLSSQSSFTATIANEPSTLRIGILKNGDPITSETNANRFYDGRMGEVIIYRSALNAAQRVIVNSYLAEKYGLVTSGTGVRAYAFGSGYGSDVAGIGRATPSDEHQFARSSVLGFGVGGTRGASSFAADDQYIFIGHNGGGMSDFRSSSFTEPINASTVDAARIDRTWRVDFAFGTGAGPKSVTISVPADSLPNAGTGNSYFVVVDGSSSAFDSAPEAYELTGSGTLTATVELSDGDHIAIGAGQRTVNFTASSASTFENTSASPNASVTAQLNLPYTSSTNPDVDASGTNVSVAFSTTGDLDASGSLEDDAVTNAPGANANDDYEADDGSGSDTAGDFNGDVRVTTGNPLVIPAGNGSATLELEVDDDGLAEQTEKFAVEIDGATNAVAGTLKEFILSVNDDDDPRDLTIVGTDDNRSVTESGAAVPETFLIRLDPDGNGETAATSAPFTSVEFVINESASDVRVGTNFSDPTVDVRIVDESGSAGDEFQERLSARRGRIHFASGAASASLKLEVNSDNIDDADAEDIVLDLVSPVSAVLSQDPGNTDLLFTIEDDDAPPTVQFSELSGEADEGESGAVEVTLSAVSGREVVVDFAVNTGSSTATEGPSADYTTAPAADTLQFESGTTSRFIAVNTNQDSNDETDETVVLDLSGSGDAASRPTGGAVLGGTTTHTFFIRDEDTPAIGTTGPGGVGQTNGTGRLSLWLRADALGLGDGSRVESWPDASGRSNDASASGAARPTFVSSGRNGRPTVEFDGSSTRMTGSVSRGLSATYFAVGNSATNGRTAIGEVYDENGSTRNILYLRSGGQFSYYDGGSEQGGGTLSSDRFVIFGATHRGQTVRGYDAGDQVLTSNRATTNSVADSYALGDDKTGDDHLRGNVAEFVVYETVLGDAQRILVENYLSAKYNIALKTGSGATDVYIGDESGNGDFDRGVFGIGRAGMNDLHTAAETDGLRFDAAAGFDVGDYLLAGHKKPTNGVSSTDLPSGVAQRLERAWFIDKTDTGPTLTTDVTVDLSKAGLSTLAGDASNYVLLQRTSPGTGSWSILVDGASRTVDDRIIFQAVDLADESELTVGTKDDAASPLSGIALTITGTPGNEGDATTGEFGGDAGWRMIGLPVTSATAGDLVSGSDQNGSVVEFSLGQGQMLYRWDDASGPGSWAPITSGNESLENGRGHILFLFDDKGTPDADPLDPSITLDLANSSQGDVPSGQVTIKSLNRDADFHVLANPYNQPYDLTRLEQKQGQDKGIGSGGTDFQATVQIWDGGTTNQTIAQAGSYIDVTVDETVEGGTADMAPLGDVISAWQGFVVERRNQGGGTAQQLRFQPDGRTSGTRSIVGSKSQKVSPSARFAKIGLAMTVTDESGRQVARDAAASVVFHQEAGDDWDAFDASKLSPLTGRYAVLGPIGTTKDGTFGMKAVESRPRTLTEPLEIPLRLQTEGQIAGTARIGVDGWKDVPEGWAVTLIDTKRTDDPRDDTEHEISPDGPVYSFGIGSRQKGGETDNSVTTQSEFWDDAPRIRRLKVTDLTRTAETKATKGESVLSRFRLRVEPGSVLPVEFSGIDAVADGRRVTLNWSTTAETNNAGFTVEHRRFSTNAKGDTVQTGSWKRLGFVEGTGTTDATQTYRYETSELDYGQHSFRLRQVDTDGSMSLSDPVDAQIRLDRAYAVTSPSPHPVRRQTSIDLTVREAQSITVEVYDLLGRRVAVPFEEKVQGQQTRNIRLDAVGFSSGVYFLRIRGDSFATTERMTVVK